MYRFLLVVLLFGFSSNVFAQAKTFAVEIVKPSVQAYAKPSFDARVIVSLKRGQKLYALKKKFVGLDGFGLFYKVRLKKGVYAYILDTSIRGFKKSGKSVKKKRKKSGGISGRASKSRDKVKHSSPSSYDGYSPLYSKSYGLVISSLSYGLKTQGETRKSRETFFGIKLAGPDWGISALPLEFSFQFSPSSPSLFDSFTQKNSGFVAFSEIGLPFEFKKGRNWSLYASVNGVLSYYSFKFTLGGVGESSNKLELGISGGLGGRMRFGRYIVGLEGKYIKLGASHTGVQASLKRIF